MATFVLFGCSTADFSYDGDRAVPGATMTVWASRSGGVQIVSGLQNLDGEDVTEVVSDERGDIAFFVDVEMWTAWVVWVEGAGGRRYAVGRADLGTVVKGNVDSIVSLAGRTEALEEATSTGLPMIAADNPDLLMVLQAYSDGTVMAVPANDPAPAQIVGVSAVVDGSTVTVTWDPEPRSATYRVYRDGQLVQTVSGTTFEESRPAGSYAYQVAGVTAAGTAGPISEPAAAVVGDGGEEPPPGGDDATVTMFAGGAMPEGWSASVPTGATVEVTDEYLRLATPPGANFDGMSGGVAVPQGPRVERAVSGSFDYAVGLRSSVLSANEIGLDLIAMGTDSGVRCAVYSTINPQRSPEHFVRHRWPGSSGANVAATNPPNNMYGPRVWVRLRWDQGSGQYTYQSSHVGLPGTWATVAQWTSDAVPTTFGMHMTATGPDSFGREIRIARVVDMAARGGDDATSAAPETVTRTPVQSVDFTGLSALPAWLTGETNAGGSITVANDVAALSIDMGVTDSYAWLLGPTNLTRDHGVLCRYRFPQPSAFNSFVGLAIRTATTTDLPASSAVVPDKYRPGTGALVEVNGSGSFGDILRVLTAHPVPPTETYDGTAEFNGFSMILENLDGEVSGSDGTWLWCRLEAVGPRLRARFWPDGGAEPTDWQYEAEEHTQVAGTGVSFAWAHNDDTEAGMSAVEVSAMEVYELTTP